MRLQVPAPPVGAAAHEFGALGLAAGGDAAYAHAYAPRPCPRPLPAEDPGPCVRGSWDL